MPAIRDYTVDKTTVANTTFTLQLPIYQEGDLLVAILTSDSSTATSAFSASGWTVLFRQVYNLTLAVLYKIAGASETAPTFTNTISSTFNGALLAIEDVDVATPFNNGTGYTVANVSATTKYTLPTRTTTQNDCLILYAVGNNAVGAPNILQGAVTWATGKDGSNHSDGFGWTIQKNAGTTPTIKGTFTASSGTGISSVIAINPPPTGAQVIPPYCAADDSVYMDPINGSVAWGGNSAIGAAVTTYFGTTLAGSTLSNGTVQGVTGSALNPYLTSGQITGVAGQWAGAFQNIVLVNKPADISNKNILLHIMPSTPLYLFNTDSITSEGKVGFAWGMCSNANVDYKVWHVHGAGTAWGANRTPCVINPSNTSGLIQETGVLDPNNFTQFGYFVSSKGAAALWLLTTIWALDNCIIAGGTDSEPVTIPDIVRIYATGHLRMSALQQGAKQMLLLGHIQIGDGGTNPVNLGLDTTAIEFPEIYNKENKQVYYCSVDNVAGITYFAGDNDTIIHRNSVISSASKYKWGFDPASSPLATYDFNGLQLIGAGQITLNANIPLTGVTFGKCDEINVNAVLNNCIFSETAGASAVIITDNVAMGKLTNCQFKNNNVAIKILAAGTYSLDGLMFSGNTYDIENASNGAVTINCTNGSNPATYVNTNGGTTTINNGVTLTLTDLKVGTEVRIYRVSDGLELFGEESTGTSTTYSYGYAGDTPVYIQIFHTLYEPMTLYITLSNTNNAIPIQQRYDRNYLNP